MLVRLERSRRYSAKHFEAYRDMILSEPIRFRICETVEKILLVLISSSIDIARVVCYYYSRINAENVKNNVSIRRSIVIKK